MSLTRAEKLGRAETEDVRLGVRTVYGKVSEAQDNAKFCKDNKWNVADGYYSVHFLRVRKGGSGDEGAERVLQKKENK